MSWKVHFDDDDDVDEDDDDDDVDEDDLARPTAVLQSQLCAIWLYSPSVRSSLNHFLKNLQLKK